MMISNPDQSASSTAVHAGNAKDSVPQSPCGAPSSSSVRHNAADGDDGGIKNIHDAMAMMTMTEGGNVADPTKENVRPNSGKRNKWRQKVKNKNHRRVAAADVDGGATAVADAVEDNQKTKNSVEKKKGKKGKNKPQWKNKKAVVVEISSSQQQQPASASRPAILPSMDDVASAVDANAADDGGTNSPSSNEDSSSGGGRVKKSRPWKNKKYPRRHRPKAKMDGSPLPPSVDDFSTNAGGASVLAMLGQYPYAVPASVEGSYDGSSSPSSQVMMAGGGDSSYLAQYDPSSIPSDGMQYPYATPAMQQSATIMMPAGGYYVPVTMTHHNGAVYYNQYTGTTAEYPAYYNADDGYAQYGTMAEQSSAHHHEEGTPTKTLNIDAPAFNPKESYGDE